VVRRGSCRRQDHWPGFRHCDFRVGENVVMMKTRECKRTGEGCTRLQHVVPLFMAVHVEYNFPRIYKTI